jgi:DNA-directed RNA polymerase specialized sigma24 family protein
MAVGDEPVPHESDPATACQRAWDRATLQTVLAELRTRVSELNFRLLQKRLIECQDVSDVADALHLTPEQVRYRLYRTLRKLRALMALYTGKDIGLDR